MERKFIEKSTCYHVQEYVEGILDGLTNENKEVILNHFLTYPIHAFQTYKYVCKVTNFPICTYEDYITNYRIIRSKIQEELDKQRTIENENLYNYPFIGTYLIFNHSRTNKQRFNLDIDYERFIDLCKEVKHKQYTKDIFEKCSNEFFGTN